MQINNTLSSNLNFDTNITHNKKNEIDKSNEIVKSQNSEFHLDIKNNINFKEISFNLTNKEIDEKINTLHDMKDKLVNPSLEKLPTYDTDLTISIVKTVPQTAKEYHLSKINEYNDEELKKERDKFIPLLNPNQKFSNQREKNSFKAQVDDLDWSVLSKEESQILKNNLEKARSTGFDTFDKANDFDSISDLVYFEKKRLESSNSLSLNRSFLIDSNGLSGMNTSKNGSFSMTERISSSFGNNQISESEKNTEKMNFDTQIKALNEIEDMVLEISKNSISIKEKEIIIKDIKDLLKNVNGDLSKDISKKLDEAIDKQKDELLKLTQTNINITSNEEAKRYLDKTEKLDINFNSLDAEEKTVYISNKQNIVNTLSSVDTMVKDIKNDKNTKKEDEQSLSTINDNLTKKLKQIIEKETSLIKDLTGSLKKISTASEAVTFLEKAEEIKSMIPMLSDNEKKLLDWNKEEAQWAIKADKEESADIEKKNLIENIDKLIYILENSKEVNKKVEDSEKKPNYEKESLSFTNQNIKQQNGNFYLSQSLKSNQSNVIRLVS